MLTHRLHKLLMETDATHITISQSTLCRLFSGSAPDAGLMRNGLRDPAVGRTLALLHTELARPWTAEELAHQVYLSRSAFADRFTALIGAPPITYLTRWRMQVAAQRLRESPRSVAQISADVGYESEIAFARAFKRQFSMSPAQWRKEGKEA